ncbi:MAG TPA: LPS assembly lipoprotein LptE [Rhizobacter sp.]|nr:LPS assembly lipoprotein LptE [Rhizobacter sp.]
MAIPHSFQRRAALFGLAGLAALLTGCGFELRRAPELHFKTIYLGGFREHSPQADELRRSIAASTTTRVVDAPLQAEVILEAIDDSRDKGVVASTAAGQVREMQLSKRLNFKLFTRGGKPLIAPTEIVLTRDMTYNERDALAKESEEELLYRAMDADIAAQVLRRLAAIQSL